MDHGSTNQKATTAEVPTQGGLETFGRGLEHLGIPTVNPNQFLNNCVSVTIAKLLAYRDVHEFWHDVLNGDLPDLPLTFPQIKKLISRTGWTFSWSVYQTSDGKSAYLNMRDDTKRLLPFEHFYAVAYTRADGVGHCVVSSPWREIEHGLHPQHNSPFGLSFTCYQKDKYGTDVLHEVQAAQKVVMFILRCPRNTPQHTAWRERLVLRICDRRRDLPWWTRRLEMLNEALRVLGSEPLGLAPPVNPGGAYRLTLLDSESDTPRSETNRVPSELTRYVDVIRSNLTVLAERDVF
ncbi:hypothetical protein F5B21DRAFT_121756 [Xylaria acuta]|nr:hypothetical protein F5B21DRAFT_121756 [Xylaria acuta]